MRRRCSVCAFYKVIPKGHLSGKVAVHQCCAGDTWYIMLEEEEMKKRLGETSVLFVSIFWQTYSIESWLLWNSRIRNS